jgi:RimJ/RimL family protein N-acetyltransferase
MLRGDLVGLRARAEADVPILHAQFHDDVTMWTRVHSRPWQPMAADSEVSPYAVPKPSDDAALFSVVSLADDELVGGALLIGIDTHNRSAHLGLSLFPSCQGRGFGVDVVRVLCHYGFVVRGLHRLQLETLGDNAAMIGAARKAGFTHEGTLRRAAWLAGEFVDEVVYGLLAAEWTAANPRS